MSSAAPCALTVGELLPRAARRALPKSGRKPWARHQDLGLSNTAILQPSRATRPRLRLAPAPLLDAKRSPITVRVLEDTHPYATADGSTWWSGGYTPISTDDHGDDHFTRLGEHLCNSRVLYCKIAGAQHYPAALHGSLFKPGSTALLRPEPENPYDPNAVGIWDPSGSMQAGYIPADHSANVTSRILAGEQLIAYVLREIRCQSRSGPRAALHALVMPTGELHLSIALNLSTTALRA
jgi:HIRAN domain